MGKKLKERVILLKKATEKEWQEVRKKEQERWKKGD